MAYVEETVKNEKCITLSWDVYYCSTPKRVGNFTLMVLNDEGGRELAPNKNPFEPVYNNIYYN